VARSKFIDWARRDRRLRAKLQLVAAGQPTDVGEPSPHEVLDQLAELQPMHRLVLVMRYVEDLPVPTIAAAIGRDLTAAHSLLARARGELRRHAQEAHR
jgi:RNA polymerase sigma-70 factor (ECF subfamily)